MAQIKLRVWHRNGDSYLGPFEVSDNGDSSVASALSQATLGSALIERSPSGRIVRIIPETSVSTIEVIHL